MQTVPGVSDEVADDSLSCRRRQEGRREKRRLSPSNTRVGERSRSNAASAYAGTVHSYLHYQVGTIRYEQGRGARCTRDAVLSLTDRGSNPIVSAAYDDNVAPV